MKLFKKMVITTSIVASLSISSSCWAMSLEDALVSTYNTNEDLKSKRVEFLDSLEQFSRALAGFLPDVSANLELDDVKNSPVGRFDNGNSGTKYKRLQRGITVKQNLFNGGSDMSNLRAAQAAFRAARAKLYSDEQNALYDAISTYLDYEEAKNIYDISDSSVKFYAKYFESIDAKFKVGEATKTDLATAESQLSNAKFSHSQYAVDLESKKAKFKQLIGVQADNIDKTPAPQITKNFDEFYTKALNRNFVIDSKKHSLQAAKAGINSAAGNLLPTLTAQASFNRYYYDPELPNQNLVNSKNFTTSLVLNVPIFSKGGVEYSNIRKARNASRQAALSIDQTIKAVESQITSTWESLRSLESGIKSAALAVEAQDIALEGVTQEFNVGLKTLVDVLKAEKDLTDYKMQEVKINKNYLLLAYKMQSLISELTAKSMKLKVKYFNPEEEFKKIKMKIVGF